MISEKGEEILVTIRTPKGDVTKILKWKDIIYTKYGLGETAIYMEDGREVLVKESEKKLTELIKTAIKEGGAQ